MAENTEQLAFQEVLAFEVWMREIVKTVHYADNNKMADAYNRVMRNTLEIKIYENTNN